MMTTICDKINTVGNVLQENLNDRGVACEYGVGTGKSTITDMVNMVTSTNFKGADDVLLSIFANRPYLTTGETTDVVVKLENGLCEPLKNKNVVVGQSVFRDGGVTGNKNTNWTNYSNRLTVTVGDDGTLLTKGSSNGYYLVNNSAFVYSDYVCEFDIVNIKGQCYWYHQASSTSAQDVINFASYNVNGKHIKIISQDGTLKVYADGNQIGSDISLTTSTPFEMGFRINTHQTDERYFKFKNFIVCDTLTGVTDEKGEFALYNQTVTDDTIYTATYSNITVSCDVPFCQFVDYGVTNNSDVTKWYKNNGSSSVDDNGTKMQAPSTTQYFTVAISNEQHNNYAYAYTLPFTVEFDLVDFGYMGTTTDTRFQIYSVSTNTNTSWDLRNYGVGHYKFVAIDGSQKLFFNGVEQSKKFTQSATNLTNSRVGFQTYNFVKFKNFAIY